VVLHARRNNQCSSLSGDICDAYVLAAGSLPTCVGLRVCRAFEAHCRLATGGYTALESVLSVPPPQRDKMESFWLAETLKYHIFQPLTLILILSSITVLNTGPTSDLKDTHFAASTLSPVHPLSRH